MKDYSRRRFLQKNALLSLSALLAMGSGPALYAGDMLPGSLTDDHDPENNSQAGGHSRNNKFPVYEGTLENIGGMSLQALSDFHKQYLTDTYIPNWDRGVDWKYGGFANAVTPDKEPNFERKGMYFQGRGVWMFSYLYNHVTHDKKHLEAAVKGRDFLVRSALNDDFRWNSFVSRDGSKRLTGPLDHYGDIYIVQGFAELYQATKNEQDLDIAIKTARSVMERLVSSSYQHVDAHTKALEPGTRRLPSWQHFMGALIPLLKLKRDPAIEMIARYCVRVICEDHWQPEHGVLLEILDDRFQPYTFDAPNWGDIRPRGISGWHSIQACWMVMEEALRVNHLPTYHKGLEMGISTLKRTYIDGMGIPSGIEGLSLEYPGAELSTEGKIFPWGALDDVLLFCLSVLEHTHDPMVLSYYNKCFALHNSKPENTVISGLLHTPRRFFYTIGILERMIGRGGKVSGILAG